ncbi:MAG TPA: NAD(P)-dependent oxidoreductase [Cyclobacteriaceae bacterium]|jgi:D-3-phosphoglycerate dehydrogenase|nr:NAD(P)-dependent oxidoreductase [Cyclobacteriaceae bacterium]
MALPKCIIVDPMHDSLFAMLDEIGWEADYFPSITRDEIKEKHHGYDGLIVRSKTTIDRDLLGENPTVKFIGRAGAGIDNLDQDYLVEKKIAILPAAEGNRDAVGEHTVGMLLALLRHIPKGDDEVKMNVWDREGNRGVEIMGKTVGIIGYGNMGQAFAKRLSGFSCKVLAYDKYKSGFSDAFCEEVQMDRIFNEADIVSLHLPLTDETKMMVNLEYLNRYKKRIIILNTARGEILSLTDLAEAIEQRKVSGAALDVLENEKINKLTPEQTKAMHYLRDKPNVIFTPHIAGWTFESHVKINVALVEKIKQLDIR